MAWDFSTEPEFVEKLVWIRNFVDEQITPLELLTEGLTQKQLDALLEPFKQKVKDADLWATHLPPEDGGQGLGQLKLALIHEILGRTMLAPEVFGNQAPDSGNAELIAAGANDAQKERWLKPLLAGTLRSSFSLTEPHFAGSDPTGINTSCQKDGDSWLLNGEKWYASNASVADFIITMAVTDPEAPPHKRASMLIVPKDTPGLVLLRDVGTMSHPQSAGESILYDRIGGHTHLRFEDCRVPLDHMIGEPGEGFVLAQKRLGGGRIHHGMRIIGQCHRAMEMILERSASRQVKGKPLGRLQMVQEHIAQSAVEIESARLLTIKAAWTMDAKGAHSREARSQIAMVKLVTPSVLQKVLDRAIQIHGSLGYSSDMPLEAMFRMGRALRIADGADDLHKQTIARHLLEDTPPATEEWPSEHIPTRYEAAKKQFGDLIDHIQNNF